MQKEEPPKSAKARKAEAKVNDAMNQLLQEYFLLRSKVEDVKGEELTNKYSELNHKWKQYCHKWTNNAKRMKQSDEVYPRTDAFANRIKQYTETAEAQEKANEKAYLEAEKIQKSEEK